MEPKERKANTSVETNEFGFLGAVVASDSGSNFFAHQEQVIVRPNLSPTTKTMTAPHKSRSGESNGENGNCQHNLYRLEHVGKRSPLSTINTNTDSGLEDHVLPTDIMSPQKVINITCAYS